MISQSNFLQFSKKSFGQITAKQQNIKLKIASTSGPAPKGGQGAGPPLKQAYSFEDSGFCA